MTKRRCIIAGLDLGPDTKKVVSYAGYFAAKLKAELRLLYVIDYLLTPPSYLSTYIEKEREREESEMARWKNILTNKGVKTEYSVVLGRLHESFMRVIDKTAPQLLVIGHKSHIIRPSSSERLIKSLKIPMLVVKGNLPENISTGSVNIKKILCPVDFSMNSKKAASIAKKYAAAFNADVNIIHIIPSHYLKEKWFAWENLSEKVRMKFDKVMQSEAESKLLSFCKNAGIVKGAKIYQGNPGEIICSVADKNKYDIIIMGARGLSYLQSILIGSTTESVLKTSPCPVLIVH